MTGGSPFDNDRTVVRPTPGGRTPPATPPGRQATSPVSDAPFAMPLPPSPMPAGGFVPIALDADAPATTLGDAAVPLLLTACRLRESPNGPDLRLLRDNLLEALRSYAEGLRRFTADPKRAQTAHYLLCATIDDQLLNTPWGQAGHWAQSGLVASFHREALGGDHFFAIVRQLLGAPAANRDLLELAHFCLAAGFLGRSRLTAQGGQEVGQLRTEIHRVLRQLSPSGGAALSQRWQGVATAPPARRLIPDWVAGVAVTSMLTLLFVGAQWWLNVGSDDLAQRLRGLRPDRLLALAPVPPVPPVLERAPRIARFLEAEIAEGLVSVTETLDHLRIRVRSGGLFAPGSATLESRHLPTLHRIGEALRTEPGRILVEGHTDSRPIRTARFPSNWDLSVGRADMVARLLAGITGEGGRIQPVGRGDAEPVADNETPDGRELNRRIDIILIKDGAQ